MARQFTSGLPMLSLMLVTTAGAYAQRVHRVEAVVPFEFSVSGKLLPDGKYIVTRDASASEGRKPRRQRRGTGAGTVRLLQYT